MAKQYDLLESLGTVRTKGTLGCGTAAGEVEQKGGIPTASLLREAFRLGL